jgi:hypothetical protein
MEGQSQQGDEQAPGASPLCLAKEFGPKDSRIFGIAAHSYEWTVKAIKTRECLDKLDRRDIALSTFAMSRNKSLLPFARDLQNFDVAREEDNTVTLRLVAKENTRLLQIGAIDEAVNDGPSYR